MIRAAAAAIAVGLCAACAPRAAVTAPAVAGSADAPAAEASPARPEPPPAPAPLPDDAQVAQSELARAGALRALHARGVAEMRWRDGAGDHFEQGDMDLRLAAGRGIAVSIAKLGERHAWLGSDGRRWWRFMLTTKPTSLVTGPIAGAESPADGVAKVRLDMGMLSARMLGLAPLLPVAGAKAEPRGGTAWFTLAPDGLASAEAGFDPRTLAPVAMRLVDRAGRVVECSFDESVAVETPGAAPGAWPRVPRRVRVTTPTADLQLKGGADGAILLVLDSARADAEAAERPALYDLAALRERFAPEAVEER